MTSIKDALGGNARVANMLAREGIHTMEALRELRQTLGERIFEERMSYIRNFGKDSLAMVYEAMADYEKSPPKKLPAEEQAESHLGGILPDGLLTRLENTLQHLLDLRARSDFRLMPDVAESPSALEQVDTGSVTAGDLEFVAHLFTGVRWDLNLNEYRSQAEKTD